MPTYDIPPVTNAPLTNVSTKPEWFQPRDTGREGFSRERVADIVQNFDPERFEPLWAVREPGKKDSYIVIGGHHRLEAARQLGIKDIPLRILKGDPRKSADRARLFDLADLSNYSISEPGLSEQVTTVRRKLGEGLVAHQIAPLIRKRKSDTEDLVSLAQLTPDAITVISLNPQLRPIGVEIGRAVERYGLNPEQAQDLFRRQAEEFENTGQVKSRYALRQTLKNTWEKSQQREAAPDRLAGFGEDSLLAQLAEDAADADRYRRELTILRRQLRGCKALSNKARSKEIEAIEERTTRRIAELEMLLSPSGVASGAPMGSFGESDDGTAPEVGERETPVSAETSAMSENLFGEMQAVPVERTDEEGERVYAEGLSFAGLAPGPAPTEPAAAPPRGRRRKESEEIVIADLGEYQGGQYEPFYDDIDTDYVTPHGTAADLRIAAMQEERRAANEVTAREYNENLAAGNTIMLQLAGGQSMEVRPSAHSEKSPAFRVNRDGSLGIRRWAKGRPAYDTVLAHRVAFHPPAKSVRRLDPAPKPVLVEQKTLGEDFATNAQVAMPMAVSATPTTPLIDAAPLQVARARREEVAAGQLDMTSTAPLVKPRRSRAKAADQKETSPPVNVSVIDSPAPAATPATPVEVNVFIDIDNDDGQEVKGGTGKGRKTATKSKTAKTTKNRTTKSQSTKGKRTAGCPHPYLKPQEARRRR